jgi:hypothetical protein
MVDKGLHVNSTESYPSVSVPWFKPIFLYFILELVRQVRLQNDLTCLIKKTSPVAKITGNV